MGQEQSLVGPQPSLSSHLPLQPFVCDFQKCRKPSNDFCLFFVYYIVSDCKYLQNFEGVLTL